MEQETKRHLIIGVAIVVSVSIGLVIWKKYQTSSTASAAASDQSNQDQLALELAALSANAYGGQAGGAQNFSSPAAVGSGVSQSLADEVSAIENALGFGPAAHVPATSTTATPTAPTTPVTTPTPTATNTPVPSSLIEGGTSQMIKYNHGQPLFEMDGVTSEGHTVA